MPLEERRVVDTPIPNDPAEPVPATRPRMRDHLRTKLPEILLEAGSVVLAILLAFAVDEWREERSQRAMAERARRTIVAELRANRDELKGTYGQNEGVLATVEREIADLEKKQLNSLTTTVHLSQLSAAAFQAAQSTQAIQFVDFDWLVSVGRVYELQKTYGLAQDAALDEVSVSGGALASGEQPLRVMQRIRSRIRTSQQLAQGLLKAYDEAITPKP
jgi:hypothetical protein